MWPVEAISRTLECEAALADVYAAALNEWVTQTRPLVVPTLEGIVVNGDPALMAASLPPDPDATEQNSQVWDYLSIEVILAALSSLWSLALIETLTGLGLPLPVLSLGGRKAPSIPREVTRAITSTSAVTKDEIHQAVNRVESDPHLRQARDDFLTSQRATVAAAPALMRDKVAAAVRVTPTGVNRAEHPMPQPAVEVVIERQRAAATAVLTPGSAEVREVARQQSYQAAAVQNAAVIEAGMRSEDDDLEKVWIATLDGKTRDTHFAADGQRTPLRSTFLVGSAALRFPGDPTGPAREIKNCRCRVGVLAADESIPDEVDRHTERLGGRDSTARNRKGSQKDEIQRRADEGVIRARDDEDGIGRTAAGGYAMNRITAAVGDVDAEGNTIIAEGFIGDDGLVVVTDQLAEAGDEQESYRTFTDQPIAFVGIETSDGRMLATDIALSFRSFPQPVMWVKQTGYGHEDAYTVGVLESAKVDGDTVLASGYLLNTPEADEAAGQLEHTASRPSVDLAATEWKLTDENGNEITEEQWWDLPPDATVIQTITAAELIGVTLVATPAFGDTMLQLNAEREPRAASLVASAAAAFQPRVYAASLFADPNLAEPTLPTMDETTGRIFGHLACFGACHRSIQAECVITPHSPSQYGHFHTSPAVRLDDGTRLPVGRLTVGTGHAPDRLGGAPAAAHYDNTGTCFALVRVGEDAHGVWFSGVAAPWATAEQVEMGMSAPLSGDWRDFGQGLELVAALAVNTPGFAVRGRSGSDGRPAALVASLGPNPRTSAGGAADLSLADIERAFENVLVAREHKAATEALLAAATETVGPLPTPAEEIAELLASADL